MLKDLKLEDFEKYRPNLFNYALGLLRTRGSANTYKMEIEEKAKDIVQECYLVFHSSNLNSFVNDKHVYNFLNIVLFRKYQESVDVHRKSVQYSLFKKGDVESLDVVNKYGDDKFTFDESYIEHFLETLTEYQCKLVNKLLEGFSQTELSKEFNISRQAINETIKVIRKKYNEYESANNKM